MASLNRNSFYSFSSCTPYSVMDTKCDPSPSGLPSLAFSRPITNPAMRGKRHDGNQATVAHLWIQKEN